MSEIAHMSEIMSDFSFDLSDFEPMMGENQAKRFPT
jgi:hypothetical protein